MIYKKWNSTSEIVNRVLNITQMVFRGQKCKSSGGKIINSNFKEELILNSIVIYLKAWNLNVVLLGKIEYGIK